MKSYRKNGKVIIELEEKSLIQGVGGVLDLDDPRITDKEKYLNFLADNFCDFGDDSDFNSASKLTKLIDKLVVYAIECDAGISTYPHNRSFKARHDELKQGDGLKPSIFEKRC